MDGLEREDVRGIRVLLVEDEPMLGSVLGRQLERRGAQVVVVRSCADAVRELERGGPFDVVVVDLLLKGELATPVAQTMWRCRYDGGAVAISGQDPQVAATFARWYRFDGFLCKPFHPPDLLREVVFARGRGRQRAAWRDGEDDGSVPFRTGREYTDFRVRWLAAAAKASLLQHRVLALRVGRRMSNEEAARVLGLSRDEVRDVVTELLACLDARSLTRTAQAIARSLDRDQPRPRDPATVLVIEAGHADEASFGELFAGGVHRVVSVRWGAEAIAALKRMKHALDAVVVAGWKADADGEAALCVVEEHARGCGLMVTSPRDCGTVYACPPGRRLDAFVATPAFASALRRGLWHALGRGAVRRCWPDSFRLRDTPFACGSDFLKWREERIVELTGARDAISRDVIHQRSTLGRDNASAFAHAECSERSAKRRVSRCVDSLGVPLDHADDAIADAIDDGRLPSYRSARPRVVRRVSGPNRPLSGHMSAAPPGP